MEPLLTSKVMWLVYDCGHEWSQVQIQDLCKGGGPKEDFADIAQRS